MGWVTSDGDSTKYESFFYFSFNQKFDILTANIPHITCALPLSADVDKSCIITEALG